jgi:class 3 adenylate cyclase/predicted ATPase
MECPGCHSETPDNSKFCISCGAALPARCPSCGGANPVGAKFCLACGQKLAAALTKPATIPKASPPSRTEGSAERRQLTIMFCDLVGSTALSARLDPEDMREIIGAYHCCCAEQITKAAGFVAKYMGDGVLAYFGYPRAHEDDAERAVRGALSVIEAVPKLRSGHDAALQVRVGLATGLVVVGDLIGEGAAQEQGVVGETPNLAARLQALAEPGQLVISNSTRRLTGGMFEYHALGRVSLKGLADPVQAWQVLGASAVESRFEAQHGAALTPLVGREEELELLLRRWRKAASGEGQVVLLSGEPGIGKSRLTAALLERLASEPHTRLRYFCSPQHTDSALYPIIGQMERAAGLAHDDKPHARLNKLDTVLAQTSTSIQDAALFAEMLSLPNDGRYPAIELAPQQRRQRTLEALTTQLVALATRQPVLMIFEDAHWIDPTSLEALGRTVDRAKTLPVLLIVTFRPEFAAPWIGQPHVTSVTLNRLGEREAAAIIARLVGNKELPKDVVMEIVERTDGIPLFAEEMTKAVLEAEGERGGGGRRSVTAIPSPALAVPASLHASLMARLDRLGSAKEVAQIGAAIGREFSHALLAAVMRKPEPELGSALDRLIAAGLLFRQGVPPHATYLFKHALVQDAAYGTLLREPRRTLHARMAETLETQFGEIADSQPEILARHYTEAGLIEKAARSWGKAGQRSLTGSALVEAVAHLTRALDQIASLPGTPELRREQINLHVALSNALMHVKGFAAGETREAIERTRTLIEQAGRLGEPCEDRLLIFSIPYALWAANFVGFNGKAMREIAAQFLDLAEGQPSTFPRTLGHRLMAVTLLFTGNAAQSREHFDRAIELYDPSEHRPMATRFGQDAGVTALSYRSWALWLLGFPEAALRDSETSLQTAREIGHAGGLMYALFAASALRLWCGDYAGAQAQCTELASLADEKRALAWRMWGIATGGQLSAVIGKPFDAIQMIEPANEELRRLGALVGIPRHLAYLARSYGDVARFDNAWRCIGEAVAAEEATGERWFEAETQRTAGDIALMSPARDAAKAEAYFRHALGIARAQSARSWELRAATSMARLWRDQGKRTEAHDLLAPIYGWFTEGFDTPDLKEAKALLEELS